MSFKKFFLVNCLIFVPLWIGEALYSLSHINFAGRDGSFPVCAAFVYISIIPSFLYFVDAYSKPNKNAWRMSCTIAIALFLPIIVNSIGVYVAGNFGWLGAEL